MIQIIPFKTGINTCYIVKDKGVILIDAPWPMKRNVFSGILSDSDIKPEELQLIIPTHGDFDHAGGAREIKELCAARIVMHEKDSPNLENGIFHWPEGVTAWGKISRAMFKPLVKSAGKFPTAQVDIKLDDRGMSLEEYGIPGRIVYTPGHTYGSISVILQSGEAFVGCLAHNRFPFGFRPKLPIYAKDPELLKESWARVLNMGARTVYPGHGNPFPIEKITKYLN
jgi:glyoxylase-like metal-dependent hydrolase (beta-lactamase superfamily II)